MWSLKVKVDAIRGCEIVRFVSNRFRMTMFRLSPSLQIKSRDTISKLNHNSIFVGKTQIYHNVTTQETSTEMVSVP